MNQTPKHPGKYNSLLCRPFFDGGYFAKFPTEKLSWTFDLRNGKVSFCQILIANIILFEPCSFRSLTAEINPLNKRDGSNCMFRESIRREFP